MKNMFNVLFGSLQICIFAYVTHDNLMLYLS